MDADEFMDLFELVPLVLAPNCPPGMVFMMKVSHEQLEQVSTECDPDEGER